VRQSEGERVGEKRVTEANECNWKWWGERNDTELQSLDKLWAYRMATGVTSHQWW